MQSANEILDENKLPARCQSIEIVEKTSTEHTGFCTLDSGKQLDISVDGDLNGRYIVKIENLLPAATD